MSDLGRLVEQEAAKEFCQLIGCSGVDKSCPGNLSCYIVRKVIPMRAEKEKKRAE